MIIDFHTHAYPDDIAERAINGLMYSSKIKPYSNGTISGLLKSMDDAGIDKSVVLNIATKPEQVENIIKWCIKIKNNRIIPFASIHPENKNYKELLKRIKNENILGIKLHPMYQDFCLDDENMYYIYEEISINNLILIFHMGFDIAFRKDKRAEVRRLIKIIKKFPELKIVAAHTGGWQMWDEVISELVGLNVWIETSMTVEYIDNKNKFVEILKKHLADRILFGTDIPWANQKSEVNGIKELDITADFKNKIFCNNARELLDIL